MLRELNVHHSGSDGLLLAMEDQKGYGKLTVSGCGGDKLAQRMIDSFGSRVAKIPVTPALRRDEVGYLPMFVDITHAFPHVLSFPPAIQKVIARQYRKQVLVPLLGELLTASIVQASDKGSVLTVRNPYGSGPTSSIPALAAFERPKGDASSSESGASVEARILDYDAQTGTLAVTLTHCTSEGCVIPDAHSFKSGSATGAERFEQVFSYCRAGDVVECVVLLTSNDDGVTVVEARVPKVARSSPFSHVHGDNCGCASSSSSTTAAEKTKSSKSVEYVSVLGYMTDINGSAKASASLAMGTRIQAVIEFAPATPTLAATTPFLVLSRDTKRATALSAPHVVGELTAAAASDGKDVGLVGRFAWRDSGKKGGKKGRDDDDDGNDNMRRRRLEEAIDAYERQTNVIPTSPEEFTKMLLSNPNSSYLWTQFIAFHVGLQQIEAARNVAEKALRTIGMRESKELQNVWVAYMNLENLHGTPESLASVFKRACQQSDNTLVLHEKLADIFKATKRQQQELQLCRSMVAKFRDNSKVWERLGVCLLEQDKKDQLKRLLKDMGSGSSILSKNDQYIVMEHLAIHEYRRDKVDSGRAMFESLVLKAPRKSDLWQAYLDQEMSLLNRKSSLASVPSTRQIFERLTTVQFSPKVMQQFLTRFLTFEQTYGNAAEVEKVKAKARDYVSSRIAATGGGVDVTA